jgi:heme oxygenase
MSTLRELTSENHKRAENTLFMRLFMSRGLTEEEYMEYITQLSVIYTALEFAAKVRADVAELNKKLGKQSQLNWETMAYYNQIIRMTDKKEILAHFYVRYAGDMFGGQMLKSISHGSGTMYEFGDNLPVLRQKMRELATPDLAEYANDAYSKNIQILNDIMKVNSF